MILKSSYYVILVEVGRNCPAKTERQHGAKIAARRAPQEIKGILFKKRNKLMGKLKIKNQPFGPFPTMLIGAEVNGKPNYVTIGACGVVSLQPVLYISLKSSHYTTKGIKENGCFSINLPSTNLLHKTDYCGLESGHKTDKSNLFVPFYDEVAKAPMISDCPMNFLCKVVQTIPMFEFEMVLGEIVAVYIDEECLTDGKPDPLKINPIIMMGFSYCNIGQVIGLPFREGQKLNRN